MEVTFPIGALFEPAATTNRLAFSAGLGFRFLFAL
jgi:hypothetical protein